MYQFENSGMQNAQPVVSYPNSMVRDDAPVIDIPAITAKLWRGRSTIIVCAVLMTAIVGVLIAVLPRKYASTTEILIPPSGLQVVEKELTPRARSDGANVAQVESQIRVMISDHVLRQVVQQENLGNDIEFGAKPAGLLDIPKNFVRSFLGAGKGVPETKDEKALRIFRESISAQRVKNSYVVELTVLTENAAKSALLANAVAAVYVQSEVAVSAENAQRISGSLNERAEELSQRLREAERKVELYKIENNIIDLGANSNGRLLSEELLTQYSQQLSLAQARVSQAQARADQIARLRSEGLDAAALSEAVSSGTITQLRTRYATARQTVAALEQTLGDKHPRLRAARTQLGDIQRSIDDELDRIGSSIRSELERGLADVANFKRKLDELQKENQETKSRLVTLRTLERDANASRLVYEAFLVRAKETGEQRGLDTTGARVISEAVAPVRHAGPRTLYLLIFGGFLGAVFGAAGILAADQFRSVSARVADRSTTDLATGDAGLPVLERLSDAELVDGPGAMPVDRRAGLLQTLGLPAVVFHAPQSGAAMAFRRLDQHLRGLGSPNVTRFVVVTSPGTDDGKSTVALNLALSAAAAGDYVLLADGDVARQSLTIASGGREVVPGWHGYRGGKLETVPVVAGTDYGVRFASTSALSSLLLDGEDPMAFSRVLSGLSREYDTVVVDACALSSGQNMAGLFAAASDIVVVERAVSRRRAVAGQLMNQLRGAWSRVRGTVVVDR